MSAAEERPTVAMLDEMPEASRAVIESFFNPQFNVVFVPDNSQQAKVLAARDATVLLSIWGSVDAEVIDNAPKAKLIHKLGVGVEKIDADAAQRRGIRVLKAAGINAEAVAELTVLLTLAVGRRFTKAITSFDQGALAKELIRAESFQLLGKTVGLWGFGHVGRAVAKRFAGFDVSVIYYDLIRADADLEKKLGVRYVGLDELIETSDVLSLHLPSTAETQKILNDDLLKRVRPDLILINTARGNLLDEKAVERAVVEGRILGAGLDVTDPEPPPLDSPLFSLDRVVVTPHIGGAASNNFPRVIKRVHDNTLVVLSGEGDLLPDDIVV